MACRTISPLANEGLRTLAIDHRCEAERGD
jgi:hypothetical protein